MYFGSINELSYFPLEMNADLTYVASGTSFLTCISFKREQTVFFWVPNSDCPLESNESHPALISYPVWVKVAFYLLFLVF